jgi:hypothetical protein
VVWMWRPQTVEGLHARLKAGDLEETQTFDGKLELGADNARVAVDLCAMTPAGGVIIYGVGENASGTRITEPHAIPLAGVRERISQIAQTSIAEPPLIELATLEEPDRPGEGYVVATIPPSVRAPHQVIVKGKYAGRFYGRDATGNRVLSESEVAALYARRKQLEADSDLKLEDELRNWSTVPFTGTPQRVYLALRARLLTEDRGLTERAAGTPGGSTVPIAISQAVEVGSTHQAGGRFNPNLTNLVGQWRLVDADHWGATLIINDRTELAMRIGRAGEAVLFSRRAGDQVRGPQLVAFEEAIAGLSSGFVATLGELYAKAEYLGAVDVGVIVRRLDGVVGSIPRQQMRGEAYPSEQYARQVRLTATMMRDEPEQCGRRLVGNLTAALVGEGYDPFATGK